MLLIIEVIWP